MWPDVPWLRTYGAWRDRDLRVTGDRTRRLLVLGHCLADPIRFAHDVRAAAASPALLTRWPGAYTLVIVDTAAGTLTVRPDLSGQYPLYVSSLDGGAAVASHPDVLAHLHGRTPDPVTAAARIVCPHVLPLWSARSPYRDVHRLPGGAFTPVDGALPPAAAGAVLRAPLPDAVPALRAALLEAVDARLREPCPVSGDLSGGLDSSSLTLLAARRGRAPVTAVTYHHPRSPAGDLPDALRLAALDERLHHVVVSGADATLPYQDIRDRAYEAEPAPGALARRRSLLRLACAVPGGRHLTGEGGDAVLGAAPSYLASLAGAGSPRTFVRHCLRQARRHQASATVLATRAIAVRRAGARRSLARLAGALDAPVGGEPRALEWADGVAWWPLDAEAKGWLTGRMRGELAELAASPSTLAGTPQGAGAAELAALTGLRHSADTHRQMRELGGGEGVDVHAPFLDDNVVRAALAVAPEHREDAEGGRPLLTAALRDTLPDAAFARRGKGDYTREEYLGARLAAPALRRLMDEPVLGALGVIEPAAVLRSIERLTAGAPAPLGAIRLLVATELWLRARAEG